MTIRFLTSGESHGQCLNAIIEGVPYGYELDFDFINSELSARQQGVGRGGRMQIETDKIEIKSGVRFNITTASPICLEIKNKDWQNWVYPMSVKKIDFDLLDEETKAQVIEKINEKAQFLCDETKKIGKSLELSRETTASIGIALVPSDGREYSVLYKKADKALYYSKESGRGCYTIYSDKLQTKIQKN